MALSPLFLLYKTILKIIKTKKSLLHSSQPRVDQLFLDYGETAEQFAMTGEVGGPRWHLRAWTSSEDLAGITRAWTAKGWTRTGWEVAASTSQTKLILLVKSEVLLFEIITAVRVGPRSPKSLGIANRGC